MGHDCNDIGEDSITEGGITAAMEHMLGMAELTPSVLSKDPWVVQLDTFIDADEVADVIRVGGHNFSRSLAGFADGFVPARTSYTSWCNIPSCENDDVMLRLKAKIIGALGSCPMKNTEHLQVLRYEPGQFYKAHHDQNSPYDSAPGPRIFTFFLYLSEVAEGGETHFPQLDLSVRPKPGRAIVWASVRDDVIYMDDPRTQHEARTVIEGVKYAANFWTHLRDFQTPHGAACGTGAVESAAQRMQERKHAALATAKKQLPVRQPGPSKDEL